MSNTFWYLAFFLYLCRRKGFCNKMLGTKHTYLLIAALLMSALAVAQNNTNSPFSRYGYGELNDNISGAYRAMGGVGVGMRNNKVINPAQPASYTVVDSTTFMFDLAASGMWTRYTDGFGTKNKGNGNLEYLAMQFPIWKKHIGMSLGVLPYSMVGYDYTLTDSIGSDYHFSKTYLGTGGITQVYGGLSFNVLDWFAVGGNIYYMFGEVTNTRSLAFVENLNSTSQSTTMKISSLRWRVGAQLFHEWDDHAFVLGAVFENKGPLRGQYHQIETITADTVAASDSLLCDMPMMWGVGASYTWHKRLTVAVDYNMYAWSSARSFEPMRDRSKLSVGVEYLHNPLGRKYVHHMPWRLGFSMADSYAASIPGKDYVVSIGTAFPLHNVGSVINTTLEYGHRGAKGVLTEDYVRFTLNAAISETWFFKRRL